MFTFPILISYLFRDNGFPKEFRGFSFSTTGQVFPLPSAVASVFMTGTSGSGSSVTRSKMSSGSASTYGSGCNAIGSSISALDLPYFRLGQVIFLRMTATYNYLKRCMKFVPLIRPFCSNSHFKMLLFPATFNFFI